MVLGMPYSRSEHCSLFQTTNILLDLANVLEIFNEKPIIAIMRILLSKVQDGLA